MEETCLTLDELTLEPDCFTDSLNHDNYKEDSKANSNENLNSKIAKNGLTDDRHFKKSSFKTRWSLEEACNIPEWHPPQHKFVQNSRSANEICLNGNSDYCSVKQSSSSTGSLSVSPLPFVPRNMNVPHHLSHQSFHPPANPCPNHSQMFLETSENLEESSGKPHQYVVNVFVNPHASFTVSVGDQVQVIQGPATVRMVSRSPPHPSSIPEQPGQVVHQMVDDNGVLTQVIISCQANPPILSSSPQPPYAPAPFMVMHPPSYHQHQRHHHPNPPVNCNSGSNTNMDPRAAKRKERLQMKLSQRKSLNETNETTPEDEVVEETCSKNVSKIHHSQNGMLASQKGTKTEPKKSESSNDSEQIELALSKIDDPKVLIVEARSAVVRLNWCESQDLDIDPMSVKYRLLINKGKDDGPNFTEVYSGDAQEIALNDLTPATIYFVKYQCWLDEAWGCLSPTVSFTTNSCEPEPPVWPKLVSKTKSTIQLKWNAAVDNGSKITNYILEYDEGRGSSKFVELYNGPQKQYKATKLQPSTGYRFRLAALNSHGKSPYSDSICYSTNGPVPSQTDPPMMSDPTSKSMTISWVKRPSDEAFTLQMEDESTGHGFLTVYNGSDMSYKVTKLRRHTDYRFRLQAKNEEGSSKWSEVVTFRTLPDRPQPPVRLQAKGKTAPTSFKFSWEEPKDAGGIEVDHYVVHLDSGSGFQEHTDTKEREITIDELSPGQTFKVKVQAVSSGGTSEYSEILAVTTQAIAPGQCRAPKLQKGKIKPTHFCITWDPPDNEGGSPVVEYAVLITNPDNSSREAYRGNDLSCIIAGLHPGELYLVQVRAINKAGSGPWSEALEATTASSAPDAPLKPEVAARSPHSALVTWCQPKCNGSDVIEYRLEWKFIQQFGMDSNNDSETNGETLDDDDDDFSPLYCGSAWSYEVNKLLPASKYSFRVLAVNSCGMSPPSLSTMYFTPSGSPSAVPSLHVTTTTATSVRLGWKRPRDNGSPITFYHIDLGNGRVVSVDGEETEFTVDGLMPDTSYKIRVQAVNGVGIGPYGSSVKILTRSLPPDPPKLEVISCGSKFIKFKWGDAKGPEVVQYCLEISRDGENYHTIYQGSSRTHKVSKLNEATDYYFRIFATNEAGDGPLSAPVRVSTNKSPPPSLKAPHIADVDSTSCVVTWQPIKMAGCNDQFIYVLQILNSVVTDSFQEVYRGDMCRYHMNQLSPNSEYQVRVSAVRICPDDEDLMGPFSPTIAFNTRLAPRSESRAPAKQQSSATSSEVPLIYNIFKLGRKAVVRMIAREGMTEMHWAVLLMFAFAAAAAALAFLAKNIVDLNSAQSSP